MTTPLATAHRMIRSRAEDMLANLGKDLFSLTPQDVRDVADDEYLSFSDYLLLRAYADFMEHA